MARPQEFDRTEVLKSALDIFQRQGYGATTVPDLVKATRLQPGSLYAAFKNKKGILNEALQMYADGGISYLNKLFDDSDSAIEGIRNFVIQSGRSCEGELGCHGCLLMNTLLEMASHDEEIEESIGRQVARMEKRITKQLQLAQDQGELAGDSDTVSLAKYLQTSVWGLRVLGKTGAKPSDIRSVVDHILAHLDHCCLTTH